MLGKMTRRPAPCRRWHRAVAPGFTLIELMITLVILAVLLAIAVPSMREFVARKRVEGVAQELATDLRLLKSQQIQRRRSVGILFGSNDSVTCYSLYAIGTGQEHCDCTISNGPVCGNPARVQGSSEIKTVLVPRSSGVTVSSDPPLLRLFGFNGLPFGNTTIQASVQGALGGEVRVSTNEAAMPVICSVSGSESAIRACP